MRVAVIGLGRMGRFYARVVASLGAEVQLAAVADPSRTARSSIQSELGSVPAFAQPAELLDRRGLDAVIIASSSVSHAETALLSAAAGTAIFCEKPLALTIAQTRQVLHAVDHAGVILQVGFMRRFDAGYRDARALIQQGRIGRPLMFKAIGRDPTCPPLDYADPAQSGGLIVDMGIHDFDLARWLMSSEVERVSAESSVLVCEELREMGDADNALINLRFASGELGNVEVSRNARYGYDIRTEVLGSEGAVRVGSASTAEVEVVLPASPKDETTPHFVRRFGAAYRAQIEHFLDCVRRDRQPEVGGADALAAIQIAHAATVSARTGQAVVVSDLEATIHS
jgi:inositol 2-dehydrogenase